MPEDLIGENGLLKQGHKQDELMGQTYTFDERFDPKSLTRHRAGHSFLVP